MQSSIPKVCYLLISLVLISNFIYSQSCEGLKNGTFYSYPKNSTDAYKIVRAGDTQTEYNLKNNDSIVWKINWDKDCVYKLKFISSNIKMKPAEAEVVKNHEMAYTITGNAKDYYLFKAYLDKIDNSSRRSSELGSDTVWLAQKTALTNKQIFAPLKETSGFLRRHFNDTSSYAIMYIYRKERFIASGVDYYVYLDDNLMFVAQSNSKVPLKIFKEGKVQLHAKAGNEESNLKLDIKFGNKYYVSCVAHHKITHITPELRKVDEEQGELEYADVQ